jgi:hypothetical protein
MIGQNLNGRDGAARNFSRHDGHGGQIGKADPCEVNARQQPAPGLDAAVDEPSSAVHHS